VTNEERIAKLAVVASFLLDLNAHKETCDYLKSTGAYLTRGRLPCSCHLDECKSIVQEVLGDINEQDGRDSEWEWTNDGAQVSVRRNIEERAEEDPRI